jgi:peptide/nickel transport system ATP-binding protein
MAQRVVVMYAGRKVEEAPVKELFGRPLHPYTRGLMGAIPKLGSRHAAQTRLTEIPGMVPSLRGDRLNGCPFAPRCPLAMQQCVEVEPLLRELGPGHTVACHAA